MISGVYKASTAGGDTCRFKFRTTYPFIDFSSRLPSTIILKRVGNTLSNWQPMLYIIPRLQIVLHYQRHNRQLCSGPASTVVVCLSTAATAAAQTRQWTYAIGRDWTIYTRFEKLGHAYMPYFSAQNADRPTPLASHLITRGMCK
jgi:hypothetical protein